MLSYVQAHQGLPSQPILISTASTPLLSICALPTMMNPEPSRASAIDEPLWWPVKLTA